MVKVQLKLCQVECLSVDRNSASQRNIWSGNSMIPIEELRSGFYWVSVNSKHHPDFGKLTIIEFIRYTKDDGGYQFFV